VSGVATRGDIALTAGAEVNVSGPGGGRVDIHGKDVLLDDSVVLARTLGAGSGRGVSVDATGAISLLHGAIDTSTMSSSPGFTASFCSMGR
jgi:hypothetical protein